MNPYLVLLIKFRYFLNVTMEIPPTLSDKVTHFRSLKVFCFLFAVTVIRLLAKIIPNYSSKTIY